MTATFADAASRWCGLAARLLGWRPAEFWSATPAELAMALSAADDLAALPPPTRETIARMMERDADE
ncbi:phage tail assembly chaperone [Porphyrobacter sp. ULC335]|uniref:phage tail assembly chaperone n=1 Tax=Porphyrobacter sp. ULC335 TaxID=2854260 RepID=UPI00221FC37D|nr:phage tail assembly chaperone [Porphyrobacter sp. ULC335]UYV16113.1 phage tail assembly chaperone [Porphyrobacter sp. ULC335]